MEAILPAKYKGRNPRHALALFLSGWVVFLSACSTDPVIVNPSAFEKIYVLGVLSLATTQQEVYLAVARLNDDPIPVDNARVQISSPASTVNLSYVGNGIYRDRDGQLQVIPGNTYRLLVTMADGRQISATTQVPANFRVLRPLPMDTVKAWRANEYYIEFKLATKWTLGAGGWMTRVTIYYEKAERPTYYSLECLTAGDSLSIRESAYAPTDTSVEGGVVYFTHCDTALSIYSTRRQGSCYNDPSWQVITQVRSAHTNERINVNGAYGVFGSAVRDSVRFHIRVEK